MTRAKLGCLLTAIIMLSAVGASAQTGYPDRIVKFVVPFAAGSGTDALARLVGQRVSTILGQPVVIDNMGGGNGVIAARHVANSAPDGYTVFFTTNTTHAANQSLLKSLPYDPIADFEPVAKIADAPLSLFLNKQLPPTNVKELVAYAKQNPGKLTFGSGSSSARLSGEMFRLMAGIDVLHVPYKSNPQALNDVIGGQISFLFADTMFCISQASQGNVKCLAVTSLNRSKLAPSVPSVNEAGVTGFDLTAWFAAFVPAKTPRPVIDKLYAAFAEALADNEFTAKMITTGFEPSLMKPDELKAFVVSETAKWGKIVKEAGIEPQ